MKKEYKVLFLTVAFAMVYSLSFGASAEQYVTGLMNYIKWGVGILAGIVTALAVVFFLLGYIKKMNGDMKGDDQIKSAIQAAVAAAIAWALFGIIILGGTKFGTGIKGIEQGWK
jgi:ABC-type multidrug transport system permease subunit